MTFTVVLRHSTCSTGKRNYHRQFKCSALIRKKKTKIKPEQFFLKSFPVDIVRRHKKTRAASRKSIHKYVLICPALEKEHAQVWIPSINSKWLVTCPGGCTSPSSCWENKQLERAKRSAEKSLTLTLHQTPEHPMAQMFNYFHCSQDNLAFAFLQCPEANRFGTCLYEATHEDRSHPRRVSSSVQQPKARPVTSWTRCVTGDAAFAFSKG